MKSQQLSVLLSLIGVTLIGYFTYFEGYDSPAHFFWDENYHVAHAQKYLNGIFFMEPHPPLGKLLIALGEKLVGANPDNSQFIGTDHAPKSPANFSFRGYRLLPALLAWASAPLLFLVVFAISGNLFASLVTAGFYLFDNALIVHSRGAMLEGPQLFFLVASLLSYAVLREQGLRRSLFAIASIAFGALFACVATVKINGLILLVVPVILAIELWPNVRRIISFTLLSSAGFSIVFFAVWQIHFSIGRTINPSLPDRGYYQASDAYKELLSGGAGPSWTDFPLMLEDHLRFVRHYEKGVPQLNYCNREENGSPFFFWPLGGKTIDYRWERSGDLTRYLYLVPNPAVWWTCFGAAVLSAGLTIGWLLLPGAYKPKAMIPLVAMVCMYCAYLMVMSLIPRVMYLYHYFIPLILSMVMFGILIDCLTQVGPVRLGSRVKFALMGLSMASVLVGYRFMIPFTYYLPLTNKQVRAKNILSIWDLRCPDSKDPDCDLSNHFAVPTCDPKIKPSPDISISGIRSETGTQDWGEPRQGVTVEQEPLEVAGVGFRDGLGVHAHSSFSFPVRRGFYRFVGKVGMPDAVLKKTTAGGSVVFEIYGDGRLLWSSGLTRPGDSARPFDVSIVGVDSVELRVLDGGDGIDNDHACWLEPEFVK